MKKINLIILLLTGAIFISVVHSFAQATTDPFVGTYKIGGSSELFISYANSSRDFNYQIVNDVTANLNSIEAKGTPLKTKFLNPRLNASTTGDFNGDNDDEVVFISNNEAGGLLITIPIVNKSLVIEASKVYNNSFDVNTLQRIRICSGNFDNDPQNEFVIAYGPVNGKTVFSIFETDPALNIKKLYTNSNNNFYNSFFDITSGDTDGDGTDEIVLINNMLEPVFFVSGSKVNSTYDLKVYKYFPNNNIVETKSLDDIKISNDRNPAAWLIHLGVHLNETRIACGDIDGDGTDEIVAGWSVTYCYAENDWEYRDMEFLNIFELNTTGEIVNIANKYATFSNHYRYISTADKHQVLTLKCDKLTGVGNDVIIINGLSDICVFSYDATSKALSKIGTISANMDVNSNEAFVIADLNPDTAKLDFKKEIVAIVSSIDAAHQLCTDPVYPSTTKMQIFRIDTIDNKMVKFIGGTPHPINSIESELTIMAFNAGDFDLDAEIFYIGKPDYYRLEEMQQPLVIFNAPPVHFDLLDNTVYDLCNAFTGNSTTFYTSYTTKKEKQTTTKIESNGSYGKSNEFNSYAMAGGTGFNLKLTNNWEKGNTFYHSESQTATVSETHTTFIADHVLASVLNYDFYNYPVFNTESKRIGQIAVLSPASSQQLKWIDGKDWNNPSYLFNNEVGNILSYKSYKKSQDYSSDQSSFFEHIYTKQEISYESTCDFHFYLEDIARTDTTYSYKSTIGRDYFMKAGYETQVTLEIPLVGSLSTDVKIGVSDELSRNYSNSGISTHKTMLNNFFKIDGYLGKLDKKYTNTGKYEVIPYIYRSQCGALVLDYMVNIEPDKMEFWKTNYTTKPDLAFIQPWRYSKEKGEGDVKLSLKQKTPDIQFIPAIASPGDTVTIVARVHNFSLKNFIGTLPVDFYINDPKINGVRLTDIDGMNRVNKPVNMDFNASNADIDNEEFIVFHWKVPVTTNCSPRIYAVIDPLYTLNEIHEDNNIGWNKLSIYGCDLCGDVSSEFAALGNFNVRVYPNPSPSAASIGFTLSAPERVKIELYSLAGVKVNAITDQLYQAGENTIHFDGSQLAEGVYLLKTTAGANISTLKLSILH